MKSFSKLCQTILEVEAIQACSHFECLDLFDPLILWFQNVNKALLTKRSKDELIKHGGGSVGASPNSSIEFESESGLAPTLGGGTADSCYMTVAM